MYVSMYVYVCDNFIIKQCACYFVVQLTQNGVNLHILKVAKPVACIMCNAVYITDVHK